MYVYIECIHTVQVRVSISVIVIRYIGWGCRPLTSGNTLFEMGILCSICAFFDLHNILQERNPDAVPYDASQEPC